MGSRFHIGSSGRQRFVRRLGFESAVALRSWGGLLPLWLRLASNLLSSRVTAEVDMQRKRARGQSGAQPEMCAATQLASELEARGVATEFAVPVAERLAEGDELRGRRLDAVLEGVTAAYAAHQLDYQVLKESARNIGEIQRLMAGFAGELRKLEEGLRMVSAYVLRMHDKASSVVVSKRVH